jgi:ribosome-binding factor A
MSVRTEKVASLVKEVISEIFQHHFRMEEVGLITVTEVRVSPDLKNAKVFVSIFGDAKRKKNVLALLEGEKGTVRSELGRNLNLKFTPHLTFLLDDSLDRAMRIEDLLNQIHKESPPPEDKSEGR